jgi:DNA-binding transcriptional regulator/RsmH inhibitor MraZ
MLVARSLREFSALLSEVVMVGEAVVEELLDEEIWSVMFASVIY